MKTKKQRKEELARQGLKQCPHCTEPKVLSEFGKDKLKIDGLKCWCKEHLKKYRSKPEVKIKISKRGRSYRDKNRVVLQKKRKTYNEKTKEKRNKRARENYLQNKLKILKLNKDYRDNNKIKINKQKRKYEKNKRKTDINFKIKASLRTRIIHALKGKNKSLSTMFLIGCDIEYLMYCIQEQFTKGMSWDNHGRGLNGAMEWHIDHIKPCAKFDLSDPKQQELCFNFKNLQPLWAEDNRKKSNTY